jgi:hypothetical protein
MIANDGPGPSVTFEVGPAARSAVVWLLMVAAMPSIWVTNLVGLPDAAMVRERPAAPGGRREWAAVVTISAVLCFLRWMD